MEKNGGEQNNPDFAQLLTVYAEAVQNLPSESKPSSRQVLKVLRSRDRLQDALSQSSQLDDESLAKLVELDLDLKQRADIISDAEHLKQLRQSLQPPESAWWWYLEPLSDLSQPTPLVSKFDLSKFDWVWNAGTVVCLVLATSFITQTAKAFSTEGFDFLGTLSTISQGAGLAFVAGGALTEKGKKTVARTLSSVKVPASLHAEATFGASILLLGVAYGINQNLHLAGNWYFDRAQRHEAQGEWSQAFKSYKRALNFAPDDYKTQIALGFLHEKLGNFDQAIQEYKQGTAFGIPEFLNAQARAMLMGGLQKNDWQGGIDGKILREAEGLLDRADKSTLDPGQKYGENRKDKRLYADIRINQAIAKLAKLKPETKPSRKTQDVLKEVVDTLIYLDDSMEQETFQPQKTLTTASTLGNVRANCFHQQAFPLGRLSGSSHMHGIDYLVEAQEIFYACSPLRWRASIATTPDAFFLRNYRLAGKSLDELEIESSLTLEVKDIISFTNFLYHYPFADEYGLEPPQYANRIVLIQEPEIWVDLSKRLSGLIQKENIKLNKKENQKIIWRFLVNKDGQILAYFAYDQRSRDIANSQSFITDALDKKSIEKLIPKLVKGEKLEFADFKVVLSEDGKILHVLPWQMSYSNGLLRCKEKCKNLFFNPRIRSVFQSYSPDLKDPAELGALRAMLHMNLYNLSVDTSKGFYYDEPAIFKLKVSSDGQIVGYQAMNQVAIQRLGKRIPLVDLKTPQFPDSQKPPYADFKLEAKGFPARLTPWSESK